MKKRKTDEHKRGSHQHAPKKSFKANTLKLVRTKSGKGLKNWNSLKERLGEVTAKVTASTQSTAGGGGKRRLTFSDVDYDDVEALRLIDSIKKSPFFETLPEKAQQNILNEELNRQNRIQPLETLAEDEEEGAEKESLLNRRLQDLENEENRLAYLWKNRSPLKNWITLILFHTAILCNLFIIVFESFEMIIQQAKLATLEVDDEFNCLQIGEMNVDTNTVVNITIAFISVCVLFASSLEFASILWAYVLVMILNIMLHTFEYFSTYRFLSTWKAKKTNRFIIQTAFGVFGIVLVVMRYYDMTNVIVKRESRIASSIYGGRILNEQAFYQTESAFLQRKFCRRQATSNLIYGVIHKIQMYRVRGFELEPKLLEAEVKAAISSFNDVQGFDGPEMLKQLTLRNAPRNRAFKKRLDDKVRGNSDMDITDESSKTKYVY